MMAPNTGGDDDDGWDFGDGPMVRSSWRQQRLQVLTAFFDLVIRARKLVNDNDLDILQFVVCHMHNHLSLIEEHFVLTGQGLEVQAQVAELCWSEAHRQVSESDVETLRVARAQVEALTIEVDELTSGAEQAKIQSTRRWIWAVLSWIWMHRPGILRKACLSALSAR